MPTPTPASPNRHKVDLIVYPGFKSLEAIGPMSVFEYANLHLDQQGRSGGYEVRITAPQPGLVPSDTQMALMATHPLGHTDLPDTAIIVGARHIEQAVQDNPELVSWAAHTGNTLKRLVALCTGSYFLAAAGLLDGKSATTHWSADQALQRRFPAVKVQSDAIYLREGHIWTSAGVTAAIDLALALIEEDHGQALALSVARELVVYLKRPGGQSQFSVHLHSQSTSHAGIRGVQEWIVGHLDQALSMPDLAARAAMSERNFRRVFTRETGRSPMRFLEEARLEAARRLLEEGKLPIKAIAARLGMASEQPLRGIFLKHLGISPQAYRERFGPGKRQASAEGA